MALSPAGTSQSALLRWRKRDTAIVCRCTCSARGPGDSYLNGNRKGGVIFEQWCSSSAGRPWHGGLWTCHVSVLLWTKLSNLIKEVPLPFIGQTLWGDLARKQRRFRMLGVLLHKINLHFCIVRVHLDVHHTWLTGRESEVMKLLIPEIFFR